MCTALRVLLIEDSEDDAQLVLRELKRGGFEPSWERVDTAEALTAALARQDWDLILCDSVMPRFSAPAALRLIEERGFDGPIIIVSGEVGEEAAVTAMKGGVHDCVSKQKLTRLVPAIEREMHEAEERQGRKRAEEALRRSEERYALAVSSGKVGVWDWNIDTGEVYVDPAFKPALGFEEHEFRNTIDDWSRRVHPNDIERVMTEVLAHIEGATPQYEIEHGLLHRDGSMRWVLSRGTAQRDTNGRAYRITGSMIDITERKRAEEALRLVRATETLISEISSALLTLPAEDFDGIITDALRRVATLFGADAASLWCVSDDERAYTKCYRWPDAPPDAVPDVPVGTPLSRFPAALRGLNDLGRVFIAHVEELPGEAAVEQATLRSLGTRSIAFITTRVSGNVAGAITLQWRAYETTVAKSQLAPLGVLGDTLMAALARKRGEAALKQAKEAAETASRARRDFVANASHDLRTPLNVILGYKDMLLDTQVTPEQRALLERIGDAGGTLLTLVNDLLDFSKIDAGKLEFHPCEFNPRDSLKNALVPFIRQAQSKGLRLTWAMADDIPATLVGDADRLQQILANLLGNAIKFTEAGNVIVRAALAENTGDKLLVRFEVADTGIGVAREEQMRMFQPFSQMNDHHSGGAGLGLAICKQLVELMGGRIGVESAPGHGSTFWFTTPLRRLR